jgi:hypothetical protein
MSVAAAGQSLPPWMQENKNPQITTQRKFSLGLVHAFMASTNKTVMTVAEN